MNVFNLTIQLLEKCNSTAFVGEVYIRRRMQYIFIRLCSIYSLYFYV